MPNIKSAEKRLRQSLVRRARNRAAKSTIKTQIRKVREAVAAGDIPKAEQDFRLAAQKLDRAGSRNIIHPNKASRLKSRLQQLLKKAKKAAPAVAT
jgi:small subunit ribosomal protein S20